MTSSPNNASRPAHPLAIRVMHWIGVYAMACMILSGLVIYNASPILPFTFPLWAGLGGWLGGALAWHLSAMWLLFADSAAYLIYGFWSGHFRRDLRPQGLVALKRDVGAALRFRLDHRIGHYNAVQRLLYVGLILVVFVAVTTGLSLWKPVQLGWLAGFYGGYPVARVIHFTTMTLIVAFVALHVTLVALYPRTLVSMIANVPTETDDQS
jgi:thiosulfate reductase cytochrome b subunit